jgi:hypothetical protein
MISININLSGQIQNFKDIPKDILEQLGKIGIDSFPLLNSYESACLNVIFKDRLKGFDFTEKKVGFIKINGENGKNRYFDMHKKHFFNEKYPCNNGILYIFNTVQKEESGGYDAAIVYWSKFVIPVEKVIKRLKNKRE